MCPIIVRPARGRLVVVEKAVLQCPGHVLQQPPGDAGQDGVPVIQDSERQSVRLVVLAVIGAGKRIGGMQVGGFAQHKTRAGQHAVNVAAVGHNGRAVVDATQNSRLAVGKRRREVQPPPRCQCQVGAVNVRVLVARPNLSAREEKVGENVVNTDQRITRVGRCMVARGHQLILKGRLQPVHGAQNQFRLDLISRNVSSTNECRITVAH